MSKMLKIVPIGDDLGVVLPPEVLAQLRAELGDTVKLEETESGYSLSKSQPSLDDMMAVAREIMRKDWNILRALAQ
jgi:putative addiction module antidote